MNHVLDVPISDGQFLRITLTDLVSSSPRKKPKPTVVQQQLLSGIPMYTTRLVREYTIPYNERPLVTDSSHVFELLQHYFADKDREEVVVVTLDTSGRVTGVSRISEGGLNAAIVEAWQVFKVAILANASRVILAHNHPSGNLTPSSQDVVFTKQVKDAGRIMGIEVLDSLIITPEGFTSIIAQIQPTTRKRR